MKCPKCGFNSFESLDACKKCAHDLTGYKQTHGIQAVVLPREAREALAASHRETVADTGLPSREHDAVADMFSFDLPAEETAVPEAPSAVERNPFNFDEEPAPAAPVSFYETAEEGQSAQARAEEDAFASLLESSGQDGVDTPAAAPDSAGGFELENFSWEEPEPAEPHASSPSTDTADQAPGEFDLENFSWDDTPAPTAQPEVPSAPEAAANDFGEFDLENFSWEETPAAPGTTPAPGTDANPFGELDGTARK